MIHVATGKQTYLTPNQFTLAPLPQMSIAWHDIPVLFIVRRAFSTQPWSLEFTGSANSSSQLDDCADKYILSNT